MANSTSKNVVVVGGSYVGLNVAESLATSSQGRFRVLLIEKNSHFQHLFAFPRYSVTTKVDTHKVFIPYQKSRLGQDGAIIQAKALNLTKDRILLDREVTLDGVSTKEIPYAAIAITTGTKLSPPSTLPDTEKFSGTAYLRTHAEQVSRSQNIAIIGGGAVGVQMATDIAQLYPSKRVTLIHSRSTLMSKFDPRLHAIVAERCAELGIHLVLGRGRVHPPAEGYPTDGSTFSITLADGSTVTADMAVISTGQTPQSSLLASLAPNTINESGFIRVRPTLQIDAPEFPHIFALGDIAETGAHKAARPALKQAEIATHNICSLFHHDDTTTAAAAAAATKTPQPQIQMQEYHPSDPPAIHLTLGIEKSVIFRNPIANTPSSQPDLAQQTSGAPAQLGEVVIKHKDDGKMDMSIDSVWARRGADVNQALL